ncbi:glucosyl-3-phosphoglycerate synthase [Saccharopolyspora sp. NPDC047091]|uniref:glucosyl-3-phosphoglycerate synthase n=1 Tax=Saccharopolyspora sp. NPDC047091 TaxID=3155924 RepID=UPI0033D02C5D
MHDWFRRRTFQRPEWTVPELAELKGERRVSVVLPALDEQGTVGRVVSTLLPLTDPARNGPPLVDELVVVDSGSTDETAAAAERAGARVVHREDVLPGYAPRAGKGEALWRSLAAITGDLVVFVDADLTQCEASIVPSLLGPLLISPEPVLVKGFYRRPLDNGARSAAEAESGGGRVTELLARPLLSALRPQLSGVVQPLAGEYAARRVFLESVPFAPGYGVEIGLLLDAHSGYGLDGLAQVNLGVRGHLHQELAPLGVMSRQLLETALRRCGIVGADAMSASFDQFHIEDGVAVPQCSDVLFADRPPMRTIAGRCTDPSSVIV